MTTETKTFIELSDIIGIKVECGNCHSTVTIPVEQKMNFKGMGQCHNCGEAWLSLAMTNKEPEMAACASAILAASETLKHWQETLKTHQTKGFTLSLEIKREEPEES
jgi:hypothetical protein